MEEITEVSSILNFGYALDALVSSGVIGTDRVSAREDD